MNKNGKIIIFNLISYFKILSGNEKIDWFNQNFELKYILIQTKNVCLYIPLEWEKYYESIPSKIEIKSLQNSKWTTIKEIIWNIILYRQPLLTLLFPFTILNPCFVLLGHL